MTRPVEEVLTDLYDRCRDYRDRELLDELREAIWHYQAERASTVPPEVGWPS